MMKHLMFVCSLFCLLPLRAATWHVGAGQPFATPQEAVSKAASGDTVLVHGGTYAAGNLAIEKPLTLLGLDYPVLDGQHNCEIITVTASDVRISGFELRNSGQLSTLDIAGVKVLSADRVVVENCRLRDCNFGIYLSNTNDCRVSGNDVQGILKEEQNSGNGIHLWKCARALVENNYLSGQRDGIYFEFVSDSEIRGNNSERNLRYGLHFMFSHNDSYTHNTFVRNGAGVAVMYTRNVTMRHNTFSENTGGAAYGILLKDIQSSHISDNVFLKNTAAIFMEGCTRSVLERNEFRQNGWAIKVQASCDGNTFQNNNFFANTFDVSTNNQLVLNTFDNNYWDKYEGYDLNRDQIGDVPYRPVSLFAMVSDQMPYAMMFWRSFTVLLLDRAEKVIPSLTPENLRDDSPAMKLI